MSYRLVTDATADLAPEMLEGLPEISVLPMEILLDGRPYTYGPGGNIGAEEFYQQLEAGSFASTSQINPTQYEEFFLPILEAGQDLLYLCFTSGLSGYVPAGHGLRAAAAQPVPGAEDPVHRYPVRLPGRGIPGAGGPFAAGPGVHHRRAGPMGGRVQRGRLRVVHGGYL